MASGWYLVQESFSTIFQRPQSMKTDDLCWGWLWKVFPEIEIKDQKSGTRASKLTWFLTSASLNHLPRRHTSSLFEGRSWSSSEPSLPSWPLSPDADSWQLLLLNLPNSFHFAGTEEVVFSVQLRCFCFDPGWHRDTRLLELWVKI